MSYTEDKDSLSVRVAYIKVNISRSRRAFSVMMLNPASINGFPDDLGASFSGNTNGRIFNDVKLSVIADVGNTSFVYDMRNIKEVFVFPKIWYRRSLARRVFLGEETTTIIDDERQEQEKEQKTDSSIQMKSDSKNSFTAMNEPTTALAQKKDKRRNNIDILINLCFFFFNF